MKKNLNKKLKIFKNFFLMYLKFIKNYRIHFKLNLINKLGKFKKNLINRLINLLLKINKLLMI